MNDQKQKSASKYGYQGQAVSQCDGRQWLLVDWCHRVMQAELSTWSLAAQLQSFSKVIEVVVQRSNVYDNSISMQLHCWLVALLLSPSSPRSAGFSREGDLPEHFLYLGGIYQPRLLYQL